MSSLSVTPFESETVLASFWVTDSPFFLVFSPFLLPKSLDSPLPFLRPLDEIRSEFVVAGSLLRGATGGRSLRGDSDAARRGDTIWLRLPLEPSPLGTDRLPPLDSLDEASKCTDCKSETLWIEVLFQVSPEAYAPLMHSLLRMPHWLPQGEHSPNPSHRTFWICAWHASSCLLTGFSGRVR